MKRSIGAKTILYPTPVLLVGTYDERGKPNLMTAAWGGICCSKPPSVAVSLREATYSHGSIMKRKAFTITIPGEDQVEMADYAGTATGRETDKFHDLGLTPVKSGLVDAPYPEEGRMVLECQVSQIIEIGLHTQFIGEVKDIKVDVDCLNEEGKLDIEKVKPFFYSPSDRSYYKAGKKLADGFTVRK